MHLILKWRLNTVINILLTFFCGWTLCCLLIFLSSHFTNFHSLFGMTSYGPWLEEILKFVIVLILIYFVNLESFAIPFLGLGFGFIERVNHPDMYGMFITVIPVIAHVLFGIAMAYFIYLARKNKYLLKDIWYALALIIPIFLHLTYNIIIAYLARVFS